MRIGVDFHVWDGIFQGSRSYLFGIYREAIKMAPEIQFVFFLDEVEKLRNQFDEFRRQNVELVRMPRGSSLGRLLYRLPLLARNHCIDLMHYQYRIPPFSSIPSACTIHDVLFETHPQYFNKTFVAQSKLAYRWSAKHSAIIFSVSEYSKREIHRIYKVPESSIRVTPNAVADPFLESTDTDDFALASRGLTAKKYIITVGRLEPRKNHISLINAFSNIREYCDHLVIVGQRDFGYENLFRTVAELGLSDRVKFLEDVDDSTLPQLLRNAKIFAYPAFAEGFGIPILEAMASGIPVVCSNTTSMPEVCGKAAVLVDPHRSEDLADAMRRIIEDSDLAKSMVAEGLRQANKFSWAKSADILLSSFRDYSLIQRSKNDSI